jgi:hypothetical protein
LKKLGLNEAYCNSYMLHSEPSSIRTIIQKELRYSKFLPSVTIGMNKGHAVATRDLLPVFMMVLRKLRTSPHLVVGCLFLLFVKAYVLGIRFITFTSYRIEG